MMWIILGSQKLLQSYSALRCKSSSPYQKVLLIIPFDCPLKLSYLCIHYASTTYLCIHYASTTYLCIHYASTTYLCIHYVSTMYALCIYVSTMYPLCIYVSTMYPLCMQYVFPSLQTSRLSNAKCCRIVISGYHRQY